MYYALTSGDAHLGSGNEHARFFDESVSPFAGFAGDVAEGFHQLHQLLPSGRKILFAIPQRISEPKGWQLLHEIPGLQFVHTHEKELPADHPPFVPLRQQHVPEMMQLATLTKPGPFGPRTIEFGHYFGIFENGRLAAMAGQRLHVGHYTEISAVCTHPDYLGKGYATVLLQHQLRLIRNQGQLPFLHVREDNGRAIAVYERLGFTISRPMIFYFLKKA